MEERIKELETQVEEIKEVLMELLRWGSFESVSEIRRLKNLKGEE